MENITGVIEYSSSDPTASWSISVRHANDDTWSIDIKNGSYSIQGITDITDIKDIQDIDIHTVTYVVLKAKKRSLVHLDDFERITKELFTAFINVKTDAMEIQTSIKVHGS